MHAPLGIHSVLDSIVPIGRVEIEEKQEQPLKEGLEERSGSC